MKYALALAGLLLSGLAHAEVTKLGDFELGQSLDKPAFKMAKLFDCGGGLRQEVEAGKIVSVEFKGGGGCTRASVEALMMKEYGGKKPLVSKDKSTSLFEGKTGSVLVTKLGEDIVVRLVPAGAGAKRACFTDDGFDAFWKAWKVAVVNKTKAPVELFKFPVKSRATGTDMFKDADSMMWRSMISSDARDEIAAGKRTATCSAITGEATLDLGDRALIAKQVAGKWLWTTIDLKN